MPRPPDPRRTPRRGTTSSDDPTVVPLRGRTGGGRGGGLADARRYTPHARSVRETATDRSAKDRASLHVVDGGSAAEPAAPAKKTQPRKRPPPGVPERRRVNKGAAARRQPTRKPRLPRRPPRLVDPVRRLRLGTVLALAIFIVIAGRLVQIQLTDARAYAAQGLKGRLQVVDLPAARGAIYDRDGAFLVRSVEARFVFADPTKVVNPEATAERLFPLLGGVGVTKSELVAKLSAKKREDGSDNMFVYLARGVEIAVGDAVKALKLPGVDARRDERREVPGHDLAASVLGFTRTADHAGVAGVELAYDSVLRGRDGRRTFEVGESDLAREIPGGFVLETPAKPGSSVRLTIDRDLQYDVQLTLYNRMKEVQAIFGTAVVLDVRTGEVLAQASYPTYDAANPLATPPEQRVDTATQVVFDPGSVHKAIVMGAALAEGVITPETVVTVGPTIKKGDATYRDTHSFRRDTDLTIPGLLALSSNIGTIKVADSLGRQKLFEYQQRFGLGARTEVGMPNEAPGALLPPDRWTGTSPGSIPIGNGVATTALQMAAAFAAIANDGVWVRPHLVQATIKADGSTVPSPPPTTRRVISAAHAQQLRTMMEGVLTLDGATGKLAAIQGYRIAGKTGTGLMPKDGGYAPGDVASFIGMAPADQPRYVIAVFAHVPQGGGGNVAAPAFRDMMAFTLGHYQVPPTGAAPPSLKIHP